MIFHGFPLTLAPSFVALDAGQSGRGARDARCAQPNQVLSQCIDEGVIVSRKPALCRLLWFTCFLFAGLWSAQASAVPSFARQTGMACAACHTAFPELTAFGRQFKLNGYTMQSTPQVSDGDEKSPALQFSSIPPLSIMFLAAYTDTKGANNAQQGTRSDLQFPQQFSLFYAGEITPHVGAMLQVTHTDGSSGFAMDNSEIRYADHHTLGSDKDLLFGLLANNNPGMSDVWQTTPVWGYPYAGTLSIEKPLFASLGQAVGGMGAYALYDNSIYAELDLYKSLGTGGQDVPWTEAWTGQSPSAIAGWAPYWRLAYQTSFGDNYLEVGTLGMNTRLYATGTGSSGPTDSYRDLAIDAQFERTLGDDSIVVHAILARESINLDAYRVANPGQPNVSFRTFNLNGSYHLGSNKTLQLAFVESTGDASSAAQQTAGLKTGTRAGILEAAYYPWENVRLSAQYTAYKKFAGASDGASDNNTIYLLAWLAF